MILKLVFIFTLAFLLNLIWENAHSFLYRHYKGSQITELVLIRAALFDAFFITFVSIFFNWMAFFRDRLWLFVLIGIVFALGLELFALKTSRWQYNRRMPLIPLVKVGMTPSIQLGLLGYIVLLIFK